MSIFAVIVSVFAGIVLLGLGGIAWSFKRPLREINDE
jgi:hypothetical protein